MPRSKLKEIKALYITDHQILSLLDFIEINFIQVIRDDTDIDCMEYVCNICNVYQKLKEIKELTIDNESDKEA